MRKTGALRGAALKILIASAPVELIVLLRTSNDDAGETGLRRWGAQPGRYPARKLYRYRGPYIGSLGAGDIYLAGNTRRGWLSNDIKQNFAHLTSTGTDRVSFFIL